MTPETQVNKEFEAVSRALIILFPDTRSVGGPNYLSERELTPFEQKLRKATETVIQWYRKNNYTVFGIVYSDTHEDHFSQYFPQEKFDRIIAMNTSFENWTHEIYIEEIPQLISSLNLSGSSKIYVSGYHAADCLAQMTAELQDRSYNAMADLRVSNDLQELLLMHFVRNTTRIDPEIAEDDYRRWQWLKSGVDDEIRKRRKT